MTVSDSQTHVYLNLETKDDMRIWLQFLDSFNGKSMFLNESFMSSNTLELHTDAAQSKGYAGRTVFENSPSCSTQTVLSSTSIPATELLEYVTILANAALAPSTQATYSRAWKTFDSFCKEIMNQSLQPPLSGKAAEVQVCFRKFKHNVRGMPKTISFSHGTAMESAVVAMVEYLKVRPYSVPTEPLFCSVDATPLHRPDFDRILHKCLASCGLDSSRYKGHIFRIGAATDAAERGLSDSQIRSMGRWKSNAFQKYIRSHLN
ncbi:unnamed protein product [Mytilus coruscus]|uniref:Tyr recombinase domain-containing protein n=1 Tax=Mytilus coruscus TaxID=42192 RepID=A0A6J8E2Y6_MYTCO|nr:unnamed protein product [Mytilus coruscus]